MKLINYVFCIFFCNSLYGMGLFTCFGDQKSKNKDAKLSPVKHNEFDQFDIGISRSKVSDFSDTEFEENDSDQDELSDQEELGDELVSFYSYQDEPEGKFDFFDYIKKFKNIATYVQLNAIKAILKEYNANLPKRVNKKNIKNISEIIDNGKKSILLDRIVEAYIAKNPGKISSFDEIKDKKYEKIIKLDVFKKGLHAYISKQKESSIANKGFWLDSKVPEVISQDNFFDYGLVSAIDVFDFKDSLEKIFIDIVSKDKWMIDGGCKSFFFVEKIVFPENYKLKIIGDRHGDIHSLNALFDKWISKGYIGKDLKIKKANLRFCFLGDYVDRGYNGCEVISILQRFRVANWDKVILIRGNHENSRLNGICGFFREIYTKYGDLYGFERMFPEIRYLINKFYCSLPSAVYVQIGDSKDFILLCHGAIDPRFDPTKLQDDQRDCVYQGIEDLSSVLPKKDFGFSNLVGNNTDVKYVCDSPSKIIDIASDGKTMSDIYFVSGDFNLVAKEKDSELFANKIDVFEDDVSGRVAFGQKVVEDLCEKTRVKTSFRGHQHHQESGDMMSKLIVNFGIYNLWPKNEGQLQWDGKPTVMKLSDFGRVWTLNVSSGSTCGDFYKYNFDTYVTLKIGKNFDGCTMVPSKIDLVN